MENPVPFQIFCLFLAYTVGDHLLCIECENLKLQNLDWLKTK